eukprot:scaffold5477_cov165-Skeletonema_marinoi.AAC.1
MANFNGSLEAVDCHIHSVRYDMVLESSASGRLVSDGLIKSPTTSLAYPFARFSLPSRRSHYCDRAAGRLEVWPEPGLLPLNFVSSTFLKCHLLPIAGHQSPAHATTTMIATFPNS